MQTTWQKMPTTSSRSKTALLCLTCLMATSLALQAKRLPPRDECVDLGDENAVQDGNWCNCKAGFEYHLDNRWSKKYHMSQAGQVVCLPAKPRDDCVDHGDENAVQDGNW